MLSQGPSILIRLSSQGLRLGLIQTGQLPASAALPARRGAFAPLHAVVYSRLAGASILPALWLVWAAGAGFLAAGCGPGLSFSDIFDNFQFFLYKPSCGPYKPLF